METHGFRPPKPLSQGRSVGRIRRFAERIADPECKERPWKGFKSRKSGLGMLISKKSLAGLKLL